MNKVLLINGSPHEHGCTYTALWEVAEVLKQEGVETEFLHLGIQPIAGCIGCQSCCKTGQCVFDDTVNEVLAKRDQYAALIAGTPVHYANHTGPLLTFLDRLFYVSGKFGMSGKLGAAVVSCRRGGSTAAFDSMNRYFSISNMHIVGSQYWNQVHGNTPEEVRQDAEGLQTLRQLGRNMAWLLKCIEAGKQQGLEIPPHEERVSTNFIR